MGYFSIRRAPDQVLVQTDQEGIRLQQNGAERWQHKGIEVSISVEKDEPQIQLYAPGMAVLRVALRWQEQVSGQIRFLGDHWERGYGDLEWRGLVPQRPLPWYFLTHEQQETHGYGVKTGARAICFWQVDEQGITLWLDVRNGGMGVTLGERVLSMATLVTRQGTRGETAYEAARAFCQQMCERPVLPAEPVYGGNNWYYAYGKSSHQEILDDSRLIAELASDLKNRPYMVIDDGWQLCHITSCNGGPWRQGNYLFPDMGRLAEEMKEAGVRPGIWLRPLLSAEKVPAPWVLSSQPFKHWENGQVLDPSQEDVLEHIRGDIRQIRDWGYELIKHDFSTFDLFGKWGMEMGTQLTAPGWHFADRSRTTAEIILALYQAIAEAAGEAQVLGCNTIGHLGAGIFPLQRTGDDTSGKEWERTRLMGINTLAFRMPQHNTFFACDADCVGLTSEVPWKLNQQWLDLLARSGTPLFVSAAAEAVGPEQHAALQKAFKRAAEPQPLAEPLDWLETTCPARWRIDGEEVHYNWYEAEGIRFF